jgi:ssDNA-binding Zn-finger/Zn-ribbon topoisomerase 1
MLMRQSEKYRRGFYGCSRFPACDGAIGMHRNGKPLGIPADKATRQARIAAHAAFDLIWQHDERPQARRRAYRWLQHALKLSEDDAHIGNFTIEQCHALVAAAELRITDRRTRARLRSEKKRKRPRITRQQWRGMQDSP